MSFSNWWNQQPEAKNYLPEIKGKGMFPTATSNQEIASVGTAKQDLNRTLHRKGADTAGAIEAHKALETEILGKSAYELTRELNPEVETEGAVISHRALPKPAQEGLLAGRIRAKYDLEATEITADDRTGRNAQIEDSLRQSGRETRKWLPW